jgi:hypothetical protein
MGKSQISHQVLIGQSKHYENGNLSILIFSTPPKKTYNAMIEKLSGSKLFRAYYNRLMNSQTTYYIKPGAGAGGSGSYKDDTKEIHAIENIEVLAQEMFHAYQSDLGVYNQADISVRETEGDLVSTNVAISVGEAARSNEWDQGIGYEYIDDNMTFDEKVLTEAFGVDFEKAVNSRIDFYKKREKEDGAKAPAGYVQKNSGKGAMALSKAVREAAAEDLAGPRLSNGDYYSN